jgi:hypothetical protein
MRERGIYTGVNMTFGTEGGLGVEVNTGFIPYVTKKTGTTCSRLKDEIFDKKFRNLDAEIGVGRI